MAISELLSVISACLLALRVSYQVGPRIPEGGVLRGCRRHPHEPDTFPLGLGLHWTWSSVTLFSQLQPSNHDGKRLSIDGGN
ncbi:hypothetical protein GGR56DRAFT_643107 [Xylariaceae sp. FL0804]|nr:hypothetical protein GGR56DRAFT_643107 [Xylariaceae sp. FL0804]